MNARALSFLFAIVLTSFSGAVTAQDKPNILVIWGDDIGWFNVSAYNDGMMGYRTPNIDRIANEGICSPIPTARTAAPPAAPRSSPGRVPFRTGLLKVGLPGAKRDCPKRSDHRRSAQRRGLHDGPVRQEPPR